MYLWALCVGEQESPIYWSEISTCSKFCFVINVTPGDYSDNVIFKPCNKILDNDPGLYIVDKVALWMARFVFGIGEKIVAS